MAHPGHRRNSDESNVKQWIPMATYCFVMAITPGPMNMVLAASGANSGYRRSLPQILGINVGGFCQIALACTGMSGFFAAWPLAQSALRWFGACYLVYLSWMLLRIRVEDGSLAMPQSFGAGVMFPLMNPKRWAKALTLASVFMPNELMPAVAGIEVAALDTLISWPCLSFWTFFGVAVRSCLREPRNLRLFNLTMAAVMLVLSVLFLR